MIGQIGSAVKASYIEVESESIFCNNGFEPLTWFFFFLEKGIGGGGGGGGKGYNKL